MLLELLRTSPLLFALLFSSLVMALVLHELAHGLAALAFGDDTAKRAGRLTLNPLAHLDPLGTLLLLIAGFGWARPVPVNPFRLRPYRLGLFVVSIAGVVVNLVLALAGAFLFKALFYADPTAFYAAERGIYTLTGSLAVLALYFSSINLVLAVFNLLPVPPLDGSKVVASLLPLRLHPWFWRLERYSWVGFLLLVTVLREPIFRFIDWSHRVFFGAVF